MSFQNSKRYFLQSIAIFFSDCEFLAQTDHCNNNTEMDSKEVFPFIFWLSNHDLWIPHSQKHTWEYV